MLNLFYTNVEDRQAAELFSKLMTLWHSCDVSMALCDANSDTKCNADVLVKRDESLKEEGFRLECNGEKAVVYGNGNAGVTYGFAALLAHYTANKSAGASGFAKADITEAPRLPFRGVHLYMPPKENIEDFKRIIDMLAYLKLNTLILEVGGGMEYKNHPEINTGWEHFCTVMNAFPGGPKNFQSTDAYHKDSLHTELGGGSYVPQEQVRELVRYAKGYGINIVPELQMFSHAYYITSVYPQLAERDSDFYPDTVCPRNEDAYKLYFELAEEVIDVFEPSVVSIGHDEIRVLGLCDKCKDYTGHELLAYEVNRLHEFYKSKGIRISMWCEKLQSTVNYFTGKISGGGESNRVNKFGRKWHLPATHDAIKHIPKDVIFQDWLYGWSWDSQEEAQRNGFQQIFGNFHGEITRNWERRLSSPCVIGGEVSSWCLSDEYTLGRDGIIGDIWYSAMMLWGARFDESKHELYMKEMMKELPMIREHLQNRASAVVSMKDAEAKVVYTGVDVVTSKAGVANVAVDAANVSQKAYVLHSAALPNQGIWPDIKKSLPEKMQGAPVGESELIFPVGKTAKSIVFVHSSLGESLPIMSYNLPFAETCPVIYAIRYVDGKTVFADVKFGINIGNVNMNFGRQLGYEGRTPEDPGGFGTDASNCPDPPLYAFNKPWKNSLLYSAHPFFFEGSVSNEDVAVSGSSKCGAVNCAYMMEWENPRPDVAVERVFAINNAKEVESQALLFCAVAVG